MDITVIVALIGVGILLVLGEIFLVPGTTIVGIIGGLFMVGGVVLAYTTQDDVWVGHTALAGTSVATVVLGVLAYRAVKSGSYSLHEAVLDKVNVLAPDALKVGDEGITTSVLRPGGKARINDVKYEVFSVGDYIESATPVRVTKIDNNKIYVKPIG